MRKANEMMLDRLWKISLAAAAAALLLQTVLGWGLPLLHSFFHFLAMAGSRARRRARTGENTPCFSTGGKAMSRPQGGGFPMPAPYKPRRAPVQFNQDRMERFLTGMAVHGLVQRACDEAGVTMSCAYRQRERDEIFMNAWNEAKDRYADSLETEAHRRATSGVVEDIFFKDTKIGERRVYSDKLLEILLRKNRPAEFRENQVAAHLSIDAGVLIVGAPAASTEEWLAKHAKSPAAVDAEHEVIEDTE